MIGSLTERQKRFVTAFINTGNASEAARQAGYKGKSNVIGCQNLTKLNVRQAIEAEKAGIQAKNAVDAELLRTKLLRIAKQCEDAKQYSAALQAIDQLAKHIGFYAKDNAQTSPKHVQVVVTEQEQTQRLRQALSRLEAIQAEGTAIAGEQ